MKSFLARSGGGLLRYLAIGTVALPLILHTGTAHAAGVVSTPDESSLRAALEGGGTVTFDCDGTIVLTNTISISANTILDGNGRNLVISGNNSNRVLHIATNVECSLIGLIIASGFGTNGGGLYNDGGHVALTNCSFLSNKALGGDGLAFTYDGTNYSMPTPGKTAGGGAIFNSGSLIVSGCSFINNESTGGTGGLSTQGIVSPGSGGEGLAGAILTLRSAVVLDTFFGTNSARGGLAGPQVSSLMFSEGGQSGQGIGGAIGNYGDLTLSNCVFEGNSAVGGNNVNFRGGAGSGFGGSVCNRGGNINAMQSVHRQNRATGGFGGVKGSNGSAYGGALVNDQEGAFNLMDCAMVENVTVGLEAFAGAVHNASGSVTIDSTILLSNAVFAGTLMDGKSAKGGAIYNADRLTLRESVLQKNAANGGAGAAVFPNGTICCWVLYPGGDSEGGALFTSGYTAITNSTVSENSVIGGSGATYLSSRASDGKAFGAGIANYGELTVSGSTIAGNDSKSAHLGGAAGIFSTNSVVLLSSSVISNQLSLTINLSSEQLVTGSSALFVVAGDTVPDDGYEWFFNETNSLPDATGRTCLVTNLQAGNAGLYRVQFEDNTGGKRELSVSIAPTLAVVPQDQTNAAAAVVTFSVQAVGHPLFYQWLFNSMPIPGATNSTYTFTAHGTNAGLYSVVISNAAGITSASAVLNMPPEITAQPTSRVVAPGDSTTFNVGAAGTAPFFYQWRFDGAEIAGATESSYSLERVAAANAGNYSVVVSNAFGSTTSLNATLTLFTLIHWQNTNGGSSTWLFDQTNLVGSTVLSNVPQMPTSWRRVGVGDFNRDGFMDYVWRNTNNALAIWLMAGTNQIGSVTLNTTQSSARRFIDTSDFNDDGRTDMLWQHSDRRLSVWLMNGTRTSGSVVLRNGQPAGLGWSAMAVHDFTQDGRPDILFQHDDGRVALWRMSGTNVVQASFLRDGRPVVFGWRVAGLGDFNNDRAKDILFRHYDGRIVVWCMSGTNVLNAVRLPSGPPTGSGWRIVGVE